MIVFNHVDSSLLRRWAVPRSEFLYFRPASTVSYLNLFICPFLHHTQGYHYHWYGVRLKEPHYLDFVFQIIVLTFFDLYVICRDGHINQKAYSYFLVLNHYTWSIALYFSICLNSHRLIGQVGWVSANGPGDLGSIPGRVIPKTLKIVLDTSLRNTQQYKVRTKGKMEQSMEKSSALPYTSL